MADLVLGISLIGKPKAAAAERGACCRSSIQVLQMLFIRARMSTPC